MNQHRIHTKKTYEIVAEKIQDLIQEDGLQPGDKLDSVEKLAKKFQVGRSAVREALSALRAMGIVEMRQGDGTFIQAVRPANRTGPSPLTLQHDKDELLEFLEVRKLIESGTAALAADKRTDKQLNTMREALQDMKKAIGNEDVGQQADVKFHLAIAEATQNSMLIHLIHQVSDTLKNTMKETRSLWIYGDQSTVERLYQEHLAIYQAIEEQNADLAQQLMLSHLMKVEKVLQRT